MLQTVEAILDEAFKGGQKSLPSYLTDRLVLLSKL